MTIYLLNIFFIIVLGIALIYIEPTQKKKKWFCVLSSASWTLLSGLRHISIGADTIGYASHFDRVERTAWADIFDAMHKVYIHGYSPQTSAENFFYKDPGFLLFQKIAHIFTNNYQVFLTIIAVIFFGALGRFIYKNSEDPCFSYILFSILFYSFYAVTGLRQTVATALIVLIGYEFIKERKFWRFVLVAFLAFLLHKSSLAFMPFYFVSQIKVDKKYIAVLLAFTSTVLAIGGSAVLWLANLFGFEYDYIYEGETYTFTTLMVLVAIVVLISYAYFKNKNEYKNIEVSATMIAAMFASFTLAHQGMMRIQQYYGLMMMLSLPSAFTTFKPKNRLLVTMLCIGALLFLFIKTGARYKFFWQ